MTDDSNDFEGFRVVDGGDLADDDFAAPGRSVFDDDDMSFEEDDDVIPHWSEPPTGAVPQVGGQPTGGVTFEPAPEPTLQEAEPDELAAWAEVSSTPRWADEEPDRSAHDQPVPGANDGTSGVAVLLELLSMLATELPSDVGISVLLFDGEELGHPGTASSGGYCMGSRAFAQQVAEARPPWFSAAQLGIVLDMVGDRDLNVLVDPRSDHQVHQLVLVDRLGQETECATLRGQYGVRNRAVRRNYDDTQSG